MGYYTYYTLTVYDENMKYLDKATEEHRISISNEVLGKNDPDFQKFEHPILFEDGMKWYEHEEDMREYSKKYPEFIFMLAGEGEESGDFWRQYFKNGKAQFSGGQITFDAYDESKLK